MNKGEFKNVKKRGGGGYLVAKNSILITQNNEDTCKNIQDNPHFLHFSQNCEKSKKSINNSKNNNEFYLKNDFTKINNTNKNYLENTNKKVDDYYLNNKNFASFKNSYKTNVKDFSATTKICLWLFLFVACLAVSIGFGCFGDSNGNSGSLKVTPEIETASAEGATTTTESAPWSGAGTSETAPYIIETSAELVALAINCNNVDSPAHYEKKYFKLANDITIDSTTWTPIACDPAGEAYDSLYFSGNFDGGGYTILFDGALNQTLGISGFERVFYGTLFGHVNGGTDPETNTTYGNIQNVNLNIDSIAITGGKFGYMAGSCIGGIVGCAENGIIKNCGFIGDFSYNSPIASVQCGGIAGYVTKIIECRVVGSKFT